MLYINVRLWLCVCVPKDVLCVQIYMQPVDEQGWIPRLQAQSPFEKLWRETRQHPIHIKPWSSPVISRWADHHCV